MHEDLNLTKPWSMFVVVGWVWFGNLLGKLRLCELALHHLHYFSFWSRICVNSMRIWDWMVRNWGVDAAQADKLGFLEVTKREFLGICSVRWGIFLCRFDLNECCQFFMAMLVLLDGWRICCNLSYYCISSKFWVVFCDNVLVIFLGSGVDRLMGNGCWGSDLRVLNN